MPTIQYRQIVIGSFTLLSLFIGSMFCTVWATVQVSDDWIADRVVTHVRSQLQKARQATNNNNDTLSSSFKKQPPQNLLEDIRVEVLAVPGAPFMFSQADSLTDLSLQLSSNLDTLFSARTLVKGQLSDINGRSRSFGVPVKISVQKPVWVVKRSIRAGSVLSASDFRVETREVSQAYQTALGPQETNLSANLSAAGTPDETGYLARVNLTPGETLDSRKVVRPPAVTHQNDVWITLLNPETGMRITLQGTCLQDGQIGDTVRVRSQKSVNEEEKAKYYTAKVVAKNRVQVEI